MSDCGDVGDMTLATGVISGVGFLSQNWKPPGASCSSGISLSSTRSGFPAARSSARGRVAETCFVLRDCVQPVLFPPSAVESSLLDVRDVWMSRRIGRRMGMHWTMIVPATSDEYQIWDMPLRPVRDCERELMTVV